ncbi:unnamed protein product [Urochloa humidicola]
MDFGFYKRARGIKHKAAAMPFYHRKPAQVAPAAAPAQQPACRIKEKQPAAATTMWSVPAPPPSTVVAMEVGGGNGMAPSSGGSSSSDADVDRLAALYISRVQERLRRERMADDWRMYY